jgi:hypothetical protein
MIWVFGNVLYAVYSTIHGGQLEERYATVPQFLTASVVRLANHSVPQLPPLISIFKIKFVPLKLYRLYLYFSCHLEDCFVANDKNTCSVFSGLNALLMAEWQRFNDLTS